MINRIITVFIIFFVCFNYLYLNAKTNPNTNSIDYEFLVAGHIYGSHHGENHGIYPVFLTKVKKYLKNISFIVLTGDVVRKSDNTHWKQTLSDLESLKLPYYIALGNHDISDTGYELMNKKYGNSYYKFEYHNDLFLILNSEIEEWTIDQKQLIFLDNELINTKANNIFIFLHSLIWINHTPITNVYFDNYQHRYFSNDFWFKIYPILLNYRNKTIYLIAGDVGGNPHVIPAFYQNLGNIHLIASGMGEVYYENFLRFNIMSDKTVDIKLIPLNSELEIKDIKWFTINNLRRTFDKSKNK